MKEDSQIRAFLLFIFFICAVGMSFSSFAALALVPNVPGYSAASGSYRAPAGAFTAAANASSYGTSGVVNVAGKSITVPATLRMASNAGQFAKNAMRLNPWVLAGTLALPWLIDQAMTWDEVNQTWVVPDGALQPLANGYPVYLHDNGTSTCINVHDSETPGMTSCYGIVASGHANSGVGGCPSVPCNGACDGDVNDFMIRWDPKSPFPSSCTATTAGSRPATDVDWDALPDPLSVVAPELPYAPYMPDGAPVEKPNYDFAPFSAPLGEPYTKPDGSTAQPMAKVSPNGDGVTVDTYDQPLTNPDGTPVASPQPQDTPEPARDPCLDNPNRIGCMDAGTDNFALPEGTHNFAYTPEADVFSGSCPAPINVLGQTLSYQPACDAMTMIRPMVLGMAGLMSAFILFGAFRGGD